MDPSEEGITEAKHRYKKSMPLFRADFRVGDFTEGTWRDEFTLVSCQFALQYYFDTFDHAWHALSTLATSLKKGGRFVGTLPSTERIRRRNWAAFGNEYYRVVLGDDNNYTFWIKDTLEAKSTPFVTHEALLDATRLLGLKCVLLQSFEDFAKTNELGKVLMHMHPPAISQDLLEITTLYDVFVFEKI